MLSEVIALDFMRSAPKGKTGPAVLTCETGDGTTVELVAKFSAGCEERTVNLARETIAACLAGDLGIPVPEPFLVRVPADFVSALPDRDVRERVERSCPVAFGSKLVTGGYSEWNDADSLSETMVQVAGAAFAFDGIVQNPDRLRGQNANCLVRGAELRFIDHELAFSHRLILGWIGPWVTGGFQHMTQGRGHIFSAKLRHRVIDYDAIKAAWNGLSDHRLEAYGEAIPSEWASAAADVHAALLLIREARDKIDECLDEMRRVLA